MRERRRFEQEIDVLAEISREHLILSEVTADRTKTFPSGESLPVITGPEGQGEEYYDPNHSSNLLLDTSSIHRSKRLSKDITVGDLAKSGSKQFFKARIDPKLLVCLQAIIDHVGKPITVTSGYRSHGYDWKRHLRAKKKNPKAKFTRESQHRSGKAADIKVQGLDPLDIAKAVIDAYGCDIGLGFYRGKYIHVDVRDRFQSWDWAKKGRDKKIAAYHDLRCGQSAIKASLRPTTNKLPSTEASNNGERTNWIQTVLNKTEGEQLEVDGKFGKKTLTAILRFQKKYGLSHNRKVGSQTIIALIQRALEEIRKQSLFPALGVMDKKTKDEIREFKQMSKLPPNEVIDSKTRAAMIQQLGPVFPSVGGRPLKKKKRVKSQKINRSTVDDKTGNVRETTHELLSQARKFYPDITKEDLTAARLVASEYDSGSYAEWMAIIDAELNRAEIRNKTLFQSLTGRSGLFGRQGKSRRASTRKDPTLDQLRVARIILSGKSRGISKGAVRFFDPEVQDRLHRKWKSGNSKHVHSCNALGTLEAWSFDYAKKGRWRCPPDRNRPGKKPQEWVGPIPGIDAYRLMLMRPAKIGPEHQRRYEEARQLILERRI